METEREEIKRFNYWSSEIDAFYHMVAVKADLSDSAMNILYTICEKGDGCNQSDIYKLAGISRQTINTAIHKLEKDGILFLEDGEGRNKTVHLTEKGKQIVCDKVKPLLDAEDAVMHSWTMQERKELVRLSKKYLDDIREKMKSFMEEE